MTTGTSTRLAWVLAALSAGLLLIHGLLPHGGELSNGFAAYYASAWLVADGADVGHFYDDDWFRAQLPRAGLPGIADIYNVNPPTTALIFLPLVPLSPPATDWLWLAACVLFLVAALIVLVRTLREVDGAPRRWCPPSSPRWPASRSSIARSISTISRARSTRCCSC